MEDRIKGILSRQRYQELSSEEIDVLSELCGDDSDREVLQGIFSVLDNLDTEAAIQPKNETKKQLDRLFESTHFSHRESKWSLERMKTLLFPPNRTFGLTPLVPIAAVAVVVFVGVQFWRNETLAIKTIGKQTASLNDLDWPTTVFKKEQQNVTTSTEDNFKKTQKTSDFNTYIVPERNVADKRTEDGYVASVADTDMASGNVVESSLIISNQPIEESVSFRFIDYPEMIELITASY
jgi:hypothetical protein